MCMVVLDVSIHELSWGISVVYSGREVPFNCHFEIDNWMAPLGNHSSEGKMEGGERDGEGDRERERERERKIEREILRSAYQRIHPRDVHFAEALRAALPPPHIYRAVLAELLLSESAKQ